MYKQAPKSPAMKALVGNQKNLPEGLKAQIEASPAKNMNKGYGSPAKQVGAPELKATTKKKSGLSAVALANAGRDMLKSDYGIDDPNMSNKAIADSIKKYKRTDEVRSKVKQGLKKGDNEGDFAASFGSPVRMKSPAKQTKKVLTSKQKQALRKTMGEISKENFRKRKQEPEIKPVGPFDGTKPKQTAPIFKKPRPKQIPFKQTNAQKSK
tara:strand:- start:152 stop:781 length:630 start_codon:yes stop_codon:yes gene_type:complete